MSDAPLLPAGANRPLGGTRTHLTITGGVVDGVALVAGPPPRVLQTGDAAIAVRPGVVDVELARVAAGLERLRLIAWAPEPVALSVAVAVAGAPLCVVAAPVWRAVELLELYRHGEAWKVRALGTGWEGGRDALAAALGLDAATLPSLPRSRASRGLRPPEPARGLVAPSSARPETPVERERRRQAERVRAAAAGTPAERPPEPVRPPAAETPGERERRRRRERTSLRPPEPAAPESPAERERRRQSEQRAQPPDPAAAEGPAERERRRQRERTSLRPPEPAAPESPAERERRRQSEQRARPPAAESPAERERRRQAERPPRPAGTGPAARGERRSVDPPTPPAQSSAELRRLVDELVGAGPRGASGPEHITFALGPVAEARVTLRRLAESALLDVALRLGELALDDRKAQAALRATGRARLGRICFADGVAWAAAGATLDPVSLDVGVLSMLLGEAWGTARDFAEDGGLVGPVHDVATAERPRVLRRASVGRFAPLDAWTDAHALLRRAGFHPLIDAPQALQAPAAGTLRVGPVRRGSGEDPVWLAAVERLVLADAQADDGGWTRLAGANRIEEPVRLGLLDEPGRGARPSLVLGLAALALTRGLPRPLLATTLAAVDDATAEARPRIARLAVEGAPDRSDLPWPAAARPWDGPVRGPALTGLAREVLLLPPGIPAPVELPERVHAMDRSLDRVARGYLAHLALARAEAEGPSTGWDDVARELVEQVPPDATPADPTLAGSLGVRARRLAGLTPTLARMELPAGAPPAPHRWL